MALTRCHFDHTGGAKAFRDEFGCKIVMHELDSVYIESGDNQVTGAWDGARLEPFAIDIKSQVRETTFATGIGSLKVIFCPGHSPGSVVYTTEIDGEIIL
ncbi:MAG: MBL fold metallo-hydrolase [Desulfomonilaceae bacterium]